MKLQIIVTSMVSACTLAISWPASAQGTLSSAAASQQVVNLGGCPLAGRDTGCLVMLKKGQTYDISAAPAQIDPKHPNEPPAPPKVGYFEIKASGTVTPGEAGKCTEGAHVENITWRYLKVKCLTPIRP